MYYTINQIKEFAQSNKKRVIDIRIENKYVVVELNTGVRFKILKDWKIEK